MRNGMLIVISGPSGSGKGTVIKKLTADDKYALSVSMTTRNARPGEVDKKDYFFCTKDEFLKARDDGELLEWAEYCGNFYGTPKKYVEDRINNGIVVILEIDTEGAFNIKKTIPETVLMFMLSPTFRDLRTRLADRNSEDEESIKKRLEIAQHEITLINNYDYVIINDDVDETVKKINNIIRVESYKPQRCQHVVKNFLLNIES